MESISISLQTKIWINLKIGNSNQYITACKRDSPFVSMFLDNKGLWLLIRWIEYEIIRSSEIEKAEAIEALMSGSCYYKVIRLWGEIQFVISFSDIKIQYEESFPDTKVKFVASFPDKCGLWQITESFPDIKVQIVASFSDIKVKVVESFPWVD